jgi:hypothetical protein
VPESLEALMPDGPMVALHREQAVATLPLSTPLFATKSSTSSVASCPPSHWQNATSIALVTQVIVLTSSASWMLGSAVPTPSL